ncbi:hypothetical protein HDU98_012290 [Podochytrium sp. JEL0797]|nr:hypothetical protein HDU98_012290 [Podochytrium sp. JEL0797]
MRWPGDMISDFKPPSQWLMRIDLLFTVPYVYIHTGIYLRGIADVFHFTIPFHKHVLQFFGAVKGTRENCTQLMRMGQPIILLPGGAEEVLKDSRVPKYTLIWKDRTGFAVLSAQHEYQIVPYGIVGFEDMVYPAFSISSAPFFWLIGDHRAQSKPVNGSAHPSSIPPPVHDLRIQFVWPWMSLQKSYLVVGEAVDAGEFDWGDKEAVYQLRNRVRGDVETCVRVARQTQFVDPERYCGIWKRVFG